jgi:hypothetical protein
MKNKKKQIDLLSIHLLMLDKKNFDFAKLLISKILTYYVLNEENFNYNDGLAATQNFMD